MIEGDYVAEVDWYTRQLYPDIVGSRQTLMIQDRGISEPLPLSYDTVAARMYKGRSFSCTQCAVHGIDGWRGVDYSAGCGEPIYSPVDGTISYYGWDGLNIGIHEQATMVAVRSFDGHEVVFLHANIFDSNGDLYFSVGDAVYTSTIIAFEDSFGYSTGCHSHVIIK